jgi:AAA+ ATPase superfamily predicted ATPase
VQNAQTLPFVVGKPVTGVYFINRKDELTRLLTLIRGVESLSASNSILIGLRRTGKSSILENTALQLKQSKIVPVIIDCEGIPTQSRLGKIIVDSVLNSYIEHTGDKAYRKRLSKALSDMKEGTLDRISEISFSEFTVRFNDKKTNGALVLESGLEFVESLAEEKNCYFALMLDEFQDVIRWGDNTLKRIRKVVQSQKRVCYVLAGSAPTLMHDLVYKKRSPFFGQLLEITVSKLESETIGAFIKNRFKTVGISVSNGQLSRIVSYSDGFPDYAQRIGLEIFLKTIPNSQIADQVIQKAYQDMVQKLDADFDGYLNIFSPLETEILISLSIGKIQANEIANEVRRPLPNLTKSFKKLLNYGVIERRAPGQYRLTDAVFANWLNERFGNPRPYL